MFIYIKKIFKNIFNIQRNMKQIIKFEIIKFEYEKNIIGNNDMETLNYIIQKTEPQIIVSLTSYSKRIDDVHLVIESLFKQTIKPNKIVLWLAEDEYNTNNIPIILKKLEKRGLEIDYCNDLKSYKKIIPSLKKYPNDIIITVDDDILYSYDLIEKLIEKYKEKKTVICTRAHKYKLKTKTKFFPYKKWEYETKENEKLFLTSGAGTLFPPKSFDDDFFDSEVFLKLCPYADDVWINAMLLKNNKKITLVNQNKKYSEKNIGIDINQDIALYLKNIGENQNDIQLKKVFDYYNLWEKL